MALTYGDNINKTKEFPLLSSRTLYLLLSSSILCKAEHNLQMMWLVCNRKTASSFVCFENGSSCGMPLQNVVVSFAAVCDCADSRVPLLGWGASTVGRGVPTAAPAPSGGVAPCDFS